MSGELRVIPRLLQGTGLTAMGLLGWWFLQGVPRRAWRLGQIWRQEHVTTPPPAAFFPQIEWLYQHRLSQVMGMTVLVVLGLLIGGAAGLARRTWDLKAGYRVGMWSTGTVSAGVVVALAGLYLVAPWPLSAFWVAWALAGLVGVVGYLLTRGCPLLP